MDPAALMLLPQWRNHETSYCRIAPVLEPCLYERQNPGKIRTLLDQADRAMLCEEYTLVIALYAEAASSSPTQSAKHGFCLGMQGHNDAAEALLDESNVGDYP